MSEAGQTTPKPRALASLLVNPPAPPRELRQSDVAALSWHLERGLIAFERSPFGAMLERVELFGFGSIRCSKCLGSGVRRRSGNWCTPCNGTGALAYGLDWSTNVDEVMPANDDSGSGRGYVPDDSMMARYAIVSRRLGMLPERLRAVGEAYHGHAGLRCSDAHAWRMVAVYPLTPAGKRLIRMMPNTYTTDEERERYHASPPYERAFRHVASERIKSDPNRRQLIEAAEQQATELYLAFVDAWEATREASGRRATHPAVAPQNDAVAPATAEEGGKS